MNSKIQDTSISADAGENLKNQSEDSLKNPEISFSQMKAEMSVAPNCISRAQLDTKLIHSYEQAMARQGRLLPEVFEALERKRAL